MKYLYIIILLAFALASCDDKLEVDTPSFDVYLEEGTTYKVGDTVRFLFMGDADNLTFFSGAPGADYEYKNRTSVEGGIPQFQIDTQYGGGGTQTESLRILVTADLEAMDSTNIVNADWTDITDDVPHAVNATRVSSGEVDLSDYVVEGKPLFIAFRFISETNPTKAAGTWIVNTLTASTLLPDGSALPIATNSTMDYSMFNFKNETEWYTRTYEGEVQALIIGGGANGPENDDWMVSKPLFFTKVPPDAGFAIQNAGTDKLEYYEHIYDSPGTYNVTFIASNSSVDDFKEVKKQFTITVTEAEE